MQKLPKSDKLKVSKDKKRNLRDIYNWLDKKKPETSNEFFDLLKDLHPKIPICKLFEIESLFTKKPDPVHINFLISIIDSRIKELNKFIQSSLPGYKKITKKSYYRWFKSLPLDMCHQIINKSSLNKLARISKEVPTDIAMFDIFTESLNSRIDREFRSWLNNIAKNEISTDTIFDSVQREISNILLNYNTKFDFLPYIKRILFNEFAKEFNEFAKNYPTRIVERHTNEHEPNAYYVTHSFITVSLLLFLKLNNKPHHKLIFWHEYMYYVKVPDNEIKNKSKRTGAGLSVNPKKIEHDTFIQEKGEFKLEVLWGNVIERIKLNCEEFVDSLDSLGNKLLPGYSNSILTLFDPFVETLEMLFVKGYTEEEYNYLRGIYPEEQVKNILLIEFFKDGNGDVRNNKRIRKLISNWNNRIKNQLYEIIKKRKK